MGEKRRTLTDNEQALLLSESQNLCPICKIKLQYEKDGKLQKKYEMAHIYPLNPTFSEKKELEGVERLSEDINSRDNFILLCPNCHKQFDNPRKRSEYEKIIKIKKNQINKRRAKNIYSSYPIEEEIKKILINLSNIEENDFNFEIEYNYKRVSEKLKGEKLIFIKNIKNNVSEYYPYVRELLSQLDNQKLGTFDSIALGFKVMYNKLKIEKYNKKEIYDFLCEWQYCKANGDYLDFSLDACRIITSFFIQNCEVFE